MPPAPMWAPLLAWFLWLALPRSAPTVPGLMGPEVLLSVWSAMRMMTALMGALARQTTRAQPLPEVSGGMMYNET
jgi:hypothetical protein